MKSLKDLFKSIFTEKASGIRLSSGEKIALKVPSQLLRDEDWRIKEWFVETGDKVKYGDKICTIESDNKESIFECFIEGKINYINLSKTKINQDTVIVEIIGE